MIKRGEAGRIAEKWVADMSRQSGIELLVLDKDTVQFDGGWIFFWDSKRHQQTRDFADALAGNAPLIVDLEDGAVHQAPTALARAPELIEWFTNEVKSRVVVDRPR
jgi:hypothetical protein